jgi:type I restriction enzyme S subunit
LRFPGFSGEWEECCNEDFGKIVTGNTPPTAETRFYENGHRLWASPADLGGDKYISSTQTKLTEEGFSKTRIVPHGATLVTCIGSTIGKMGMASQKMSTNQQINTIIPNDLTDGQYLYYAVQSQFPRYVKSIAVQAVPIISKSSFEKLKNYRPHIDEQKKIGSFLDLLDRRISIQNRVIEKYESLIKALAYEAIGKHTPNITLSECVRCTSSTLKESDLEEVGTVPAFGAAGISGFTESALAKGDSILITKDGSGVGSLRYVCGPHSFVGTLNSITPKDGVYLPYIYYALQNVCFESYRTGQAIPHIYFKDYGKEIIYCPAFDDQKRLAKGLEIIDAKIEVERAVLQTLQSAKTYLLSVMFI